MYVLGAEMSIFRLGGKGKGMYPKNEKNQQVNWKKCGEMRLVEPFLKNRVIISAYALVNGRLQAFICPSKGSKAFSIL